MSHVTDVILSIGLLEESDDAENPALIAEINTWLDEREKGTLARVDQFAGGRKASQATIYLGAFNYLPIDGFVDFVKGLAWRCPDELQVWIKDEHDDVFSAR